MIPQAATRTAMLEWRNSFQSAERAIAEETPVAVSYNRIAHAVMMATPSDLEDFATGFSLSEGIVTTPDEIEEMEIVGAARGVECRMWIAPGLLDRLEERRRFLAGPTGCGMCGLESLAEAVRTPPQVGPGVVIGADELQKAMVGMQGRQTLNAETHAVHAAGFWSRDDGVVAVREDVGRHNALDKLAGALARRRLDPATGVVLMTSRISVELVQKAATAGASILVAVSAPTRLALEVADAAGITLVGVARRDGFEIFTHPHRIVGAIGGR